MVNLIDGIIAARRWYGWPVSILLAIVNAII
jgi:hypothetical protein